MRVLQLEEVSRNQRTSQSRLNRCPPTKHPAAVQDVTWRRAAGARAAGATIGTTPPLGYWRQRSRLLPPHNKLHVASKCEISISAISALHTQGDYQSGED